MARALHIHVTGPTAAGDSETVTVGTNILVGIDGSADLTDSYPVTLDTTITVLGIDVYLTSVQMNAAIADAVKAFLYSSQSIPTNGYAVTYVSGAYGLLNIL